MNDQAFTETTRLKPFTRIVSVPAAWPWDQARAARLEAQHTSPVSGDDVSIVVRRLKRWALGEPGKFVAIYLRGPDIRNGVRFDLEIQGQRLSIDMPSPQQKAAQANARVWHLILGGVLIGAVLSMGMLTLSRRAAEADRISALEVTMARKAHEAQGILRAKDDALALSQLGHGAHTLDAAVQDLKTLSLKRDSASRIDAFYWNKGYWAIEVHGKDAPIRDATLSLQRSNKPIRKDVWLWVSGEEDPLP